MNDKLKILTAAAAGVVAIAATAVYFIKDLSAGTADTTADTPDDETPKEEPTA